MIGQTQERRTLTETDTALGPSTYYHYPAIKDPGWGWEVILYFFFGGLAGGSHLVATLAEIFGGPDDRVVARAGRYIALLTMAICPLLLVIDLGRPERFTHMLRIVKSRSPMSMGTWGLSGFALFVFLGAIRQAVEDGVFGRKSLPAQLLAWVPFPVSGLVGTLFAFFVASYTGVLLSFTNIPLWAKNRLWQGAFFLASALSTGLAAISLTLTLSGKCPSPDRDWVERAGTSATLGEIGLLAGSLATLGLQRRTLLTSRHGLLFWLGWVGLGLILPLLVRCVRDDAPESRRRTRSITANALVLLGGLVLRAVTVVAGREQASHPEAYFRFTNRRRLGRRDRSSR